MYKILSVVIIILLSLGGVGSWIGYKYYQSTQSRIETLVEKNSALEGALDVSNATIEFIKKNEVRQKEFNRRLREENIDAENELAQFKKLLEEYNLSNLSDTEPGLIQERVNNAINEMFNDIESITNSK